MSDYSVGLIDTVVDEEVVTQWGYTRPPSPVAVCTCVMRDEPSEEIIISPRKQLILTTVSRTEAYLRERRIPELIRFLLTKVIASGSPHPTFYLKTLLDDCMLFRAGHGQPPVIYEDRHLQAVVKSFDPGNRGWLSSGQVRRAFITLGLTPVPNLPDRMPVDAVITNLQQTQENELIKLLLAGIDTATSEDDSNAKESASKTESDSRID